VSVWEEEESDGELCGEVVEVGLKRWQVCAREEIGYSGAGWEAGGLSGCAVICCS
jgi:hypothetical protein